MDQTSPAALQADVHRLLTAMYEDYLRGDPAAIDARLAEDVTIFDSAADALVTGLDELVAKRAGVATVVGNPFASMQTADRIRPRQLAQDAPLLMIATGLAIRSFE